MGATEHTTVSPAETDSAPVSAASPEGSSTAPYPEDAHAASSEASSTAAAVEIDTNGQNRRGRPWERGQSGNPNGRPKGSRNRITAALEELIEARGEALVEKAIENALRGDSPMLRVLLNRLVPCRPDRTVEFAIPEIKTATDAHSASSAIIAACSRGELSPSEASDVMSLISMHVNTIKAAEFEERLCALEGKKVP
jgi:hypothetical protein